MARFLNVAAYRFVRLDELDALRSILIAKGQACHLRGTILIAHEGINCFLAGIPGEVREFFNDTLRAQAGLSGLQAKESWSETVPFQRFRVKVKREIIRMNDEGIRPGDARAPSVAPACLARWLASGHDDEGVPILLLDTRNAFEVERGRFRGAVSWNLQRFSDFPKALAEQREALKGKTIVSYCTGGIRCEKAALLMQQQGLSAFQLEGGLLGYFEQIGQHSYDGDCVVFDERGAVGADLLPRS